MRGFCLASVSPSMPALQPAVMSATYSSAGSIQSYSYAPSNQPARFLLPAQMTAAQTEDGALTAYQQHNSDVLLTCGHHSLCTARCPASAKPEPGQRGQLCITLLISHAARQSR